MKPAVYCSKCMKATRSDVHRDGTRLWDGTDELTPAEIVDSVPLKNGFVKNTYMCSEGHEWSAREASDAE